MLTSLLHPLSSSQRGLVVVVDAAVFALGGLPLLALLMQALGGLPFLAILMPFSLSFASRSATFKRSIMTSKVYFSNAVRYA